MTDHQDNPSHLYRDKDGYLHQCYHTCKHWLSPLFLAGFLVGMTMGFMPEHYLWEKVWPFYHISVWMENAGRAPWWLSLIIIATLLISIAVAFHFAVRNHEKSK